mmetsp:Transcript_2235/g.5987  ORF Transcript_2235/g.5987 Transcript_2235/m.5987 type:complete len:172 (+) Transcript_2235:147-662(+)
MKLFLAPRPVFDDADASARNEESIECRFLGRHRQRIVAEVLVPTLPPQPDRASSSGSSKPRRPLPVAPPPQGDPDRRRRLRGRRGNPIGAVIVSSGPGDAAFRRELEQRDVAFLQRVTDDADVSSLRSEIFRGDLEPKDAAAVSVREAETTGTAGSAVRVATKSLMDGLID